MTSKRPSSSNQRPRGLFAAYKRQCLRAGTEKKKQRQVEAEYERKLEALCHSLKTRNLSLMKQLVNLRRELREERAFMEEEV